MDSIGSARSLLRQGEAALVLNTAGDLLTYRNGVPILSGNWKINPRRIRDWRISRVIIYLRDRDRILQRNDVYLADFEGIKPAVTETRYGPGRYVVRMNSTRHVGTTRRNWYEFAGSG